MAASRGRVLYFALGAAALLTALPGAADSSPGQPLPGTIFFVSNRSKDLDGEIYAVRVDGSKKRNLSRGPRLDAEATPSPDGRKVAFVSTRSGAIAIWVVNRNGSGLRRVSEPLGVQTASGVPTFNWAPNGRKMVYAANFGSRTEIRVLDLAKGRSRTIARSGWAPTWSPNGSRIAYTKFGKTNRINVVRPTGELLWNLIGRDPHWSPDGSRMAVAMMDGKTILIVDSRGHRVRALKAEGFVSWSPRGDTVMVRRGESVDVIPLRSGATRSLPHTDFAVWSPNGRLIAFGGKVRNRLGLYVIRPSRGKPRYLGKWTWVADWSPTSNALLTNVDSALQITSLTGHTRTVTRAARTSSFGGSAFWVGRNALVYSSRARWNPPVDLYRFKADEGVTRLSNAPYVSDEPTPSPDGRLVAFVRGLQTADCKGICESEIYLADANGRDVRRLTRYRGDEEPFVSSPTWSPNGDRIAFVREGPGGEMSIRSVSTTGGAEQVLISNGNDDFEYLDPAWSPDGARIAFGSDRQDGGIFVMKPDGSEVTKLTGATGEDPPGAPAWSADGSRIAFVGDVGDEKIYVMNADGTGRALVGAGSAPTWSPDGEWIAYERMAREGTALMNSEIYAMRVDGSQSHPIASHPADEYSPHWSR
jgi:Tol biopolymer transport system component